MNGVIIVNYGEQQAYDYLQSRHWVVEDLTENYRYFDKDIDLLATRGSQAYTIEVKWDNRISQTGNMFIETLTDIDNNKEGWFNFCQADFLFYGDSCNQLFYVFSLKDLQQFISLNQMEQRKALDKNSKGKVKKVSQGFLVPIEDFRKQYQVQIIKLGQEQ